MIRSLAGLSILLVGCSTQGPPFPERAGADGASASGVQDPPGPPTAAGISTDPDGAPSGIPRFASVTTSSLDGSDPVTVSSGDGNPVPWVRSEIKLDPKPFDPTAVTATASFVDRWAPGEGSPPAVRVEFSVLGLPEDDRFLELDGEGSTVEWSDGSTGSVTKIQGQGSAGGAWTLLVLTSASPPVPGIRAIRVALDLHQATRVARSVARLAVGDAASFDFGTSDKLWVLAGNKEVIEFGTSGHQAPLAPPLEPDLSAGRRVQLVDAEGKVLEPRGLSYGGHWTIKDWGRPYPEALVPPVQVTVEVPQETKKTRLVIRLRDLSPPR